MSQPISRCTVLVSHRQLRAEGISEAVGPIVLKFTSPVDVTSAYTVTFRIYVNTFYTGPMTGPTGESALLYVNGTLHPTIRGRWLGPSGPNVVEFQGLSLGPGITYCEIPELRVNASQLGVSSTLVPSQVVAFVSLPTFSPVVLHSSQSIVGYVARSLSTSVIQYSNDASEFYVAFEELFPFAFRSIKDEHEIGNAPHFPSVCGTRFMVRVMDIPPTTLLQVTKTDVLVAGQTPRALIVATDPSGTGGVPEPIADRLPLEYVEVPITHGSAAIVWEYVRYPRLPERERLFFGLRFRGEITRGELGAVRIIASYAPISTVTTASHDAPIPRFADLSTSRRLSEARNVSDG